MQYLFPGVAVAAAATAIRESYMAGI